jgi:hypothetical protein
MSIEKRRLPRHQVRVPIALGGTLGVTTDVSAAGVGFESALFLDPGTPIEFALQLPGAGGIVARCEGQVVRAEGRHERTFVAATINSIQFDTVH